MAGDDTARWLGSAVYNGSHASASTSHVEFWAVSGAGEENDVSPEQKGQETSWIMSLSSQFALITHMSLWEEKEAPHGDRGRLRVYTTSSIEWLPFCLKTNGKKNNLYKNMRNWTFSSLGAYQSFLSQIAKWNAVIFSCDEVISFISK